MTDTITVDLGRARELLREVCEANPTKVDTSTLYFDPNSHECMCVVGAVIEQLGKGYEDMGLTPEARGGWLAQNRSTDPNVFDFTAITVDGLEFTSEAVMYLDAARARNDFGDSWSEIPYKVEQDDLIAEMIR